MEQRVVQEENVVAEPMDDATLPKGRWVVGGTLFLVDQLALSLAIGLAIATRQALGGKLWGQEYLKLWPFMSLFPLYFWAFRLYPGTGLWPPIEIKRGFSALSLGFASLAGLSFLTKTGTLYSRGAFLLAWLLTLAFVPLARLAARAALSCLSWWGEGVLILGAGKTGEMVVQAMQREAGMGLRPIALLDDHPQKWGRDIAGVKVKGPLALAPNYAEKGVRYVVLAMPGVSPQRLVEIIETYCVSFPHLVMIPDFFGSPSLWVQAQDLGGVLGLEVEQKLLRRWAWWIKRALDLSLGLIIGLLTLPVSLAIAVWIKLDSPGPLFYRQTRIGRYGKPFSVFKFRTMVQDADRVLEKYLESNPALRLEWEATQKLKDDPRITRAGKILRRLSLDELPQLINVLRGEMSLVGPRPIVSEEVQKYGKSFELYKRVTPGITGLWQVSGRNDTTYAERVRLDEYYVRNWSLWLDIYILMRTVWVVLRGKGAY